MENVEITFNLNVRVSLGEKTMQFFRQAFKLREAESEAEELTEALKKSSSKLKAAVVRNTPK